MASPGQFSVTVNKRQRPQPWAVWPAFVCAYRPRFGTWPQHDGSARCSGLPFRAGPRSPASRA